MVKVLDKFFKKREKQLHYKYILDGANNIGFECTDCGTPEFNSHFVNIKYCLECNEYMKKKTRLSTFRAKWRNKVHMGFTDSLFTVLLFAGYISAFLIIFFKNNTDILFFLRTGMLLSFPAALQFYLQKGRS